MAKRPVAEDDIQDSQKVAVSDVGGIQLPKWEKRDSDIKPIVSQLIEKFSEKLSHLKPSRIGYLGFSKKKCSYQAKIYGMKPMYGLFTDLDYVLTVHMENWLVIDMSTKYVLILHELLHIPPGGFDELNKKEFRKCIKHNIQDFDFILEQFGINWQDSDKILKKIDMTEKSEHEA